MNNVENMLLNRMLEYPSNTIFVIDDFLELSNYEAVRKAMTRLVNKNKVVRLMEGYFTIPYYMESVGEYSYPSLTKMAEKVAERYGWRITPSGEMALNYLGLSTQVSAKVIYLSSGPYRQICYMDNIITFKHTDKHLRSTSNSSQLNLIIQAIIAIGKDQMTQTEFYKLKKYCHTWLDESWSKEATKTPKWVYSILKKIMEDKE